MIKSIDFFDSMCLKQFMTKKFALKNVKIEFNRYIHFDFVTFMRFREINWFKLTFKNICDFVFNAIDFAKFFATMFDDNVNKICRIEFIAIIVRITIYFVAFAHLLKKRKNYFCFFNLHIHWENELKKSIL